MMCEVDRVIASECLEMKFERLSLIPCAMGTRRAERPFENRLAALAFSFASRMECPIHHIAFETTALATEAWRSRGIQRKSERHDFETACKLSGSLDFAKPPLGMTCCIGFTLECEISGPKVKGNPKDFEPFPPRQNGSWKWPSTLFY